MDPETQNSSRRLPVSTSRTYPLRVDFDEETVTVDMNHPLARRDLLFEVEIVSVREATPEEVLHRHTHGAGGH